MTDSELLASVATTLKRAIALLGTQLEAIEATQKEAADANLVAVLGSLPFKLAASKKCEWLPSDGVPAGVQALFDVKGEFVTEEWHYRKMPDGNILRFRRSAKA